MTFVAMSEKIKTTKSEFRVILLQAKTDTNTSNAQDCFKMSRSTLKLLTNMLWDKGQETIDKISLSNHIIWFWIISTH